LLSFINFENKKLKYFLILFLLLVVVCCEKVPPTQVLNFNQTRYEQLDSIQQLAYLDSLFKNSKYESQLYFKIAEEFYYLNDVEKSKQVSYFILKKAQKANDSLGLGRAYYHIGDYFEFTHKDSAYYYYKQAEKIFSATKNTDRLAKVLFNKAYILFFDGVYSESEIELTRVLHYLKNSDNYLLKYQCLSLQGGNLEALGLYSDALLYYREAKRLIPKLAVSDNKRFYYELINTVDLSNVYEAQHDYLSALNALEKIDLDRLKAHFPKHYATVISNIANNKLQFFGPNAQIKAAMERSIQLAKQHGNNLDLLFKYKHLGNYYLALGNTHLANKNYKLALDAALQTNYNIQILHILKILSKTDPDNFDTYHSDYLDRYQQLIYKQIKTKNKFARIEYETSRIEDINKSLSAKIEYGICFAIIIFLAIITFALWRIYRTKKVALDFAMLKNEAEENLFFLLQEQQKMIHTAQNDEKARIALELHDGVMNKLYSTRLNLGLLNKQTEQAAVEARKKLIKDLQIIEAEIRALSHNLTTGNTEFLSDYSMLLSDLVAKQNAVSQTQFSILIANEEKLLALSPILKFNIYRILQEALLNILKHAQAQKAQINIEFTHAACLVTIQDDGVGLTANPATGIGLKNIQQRVKLLKGNFAIYAKHGFKLKMRFPM